MPGVGGGSLYLQGLLQLTRLVPPQDQADDPGEPSHGWLLWTEPAPGTHLLGLLCIDWSPVWLMPVRVMPSAAFFFSLRLRVRFRSADHSWATGVGEENQEFICWKSQRSKHLPSKTQINPMHQ